MEKPFLFFKETGSGKPVVFLHGFCETHAIWESLAFEISKNNRVLLPDLQGFGQSPLSGENFSMEDAARETDKLFTHLGMDQFVLIGHSLGGYLALAYARLFGHKLSGLGFFHSSVFEDTDEKKANRTRLIQFIDEHGVMPFVTTFIPSLFYENRHKELAEIINKLKESAGHISPQSLKSWAAAMRDRVSGAAFIRQFPKPVMFIIGENDNSVPLEKSLEQSVLPPNVHVLRLKQTGHMGMYERPEATTAFVRRFIRFCE